MCYSGAQPRLTKKRSHFRQPIKNPRNLLRPLKAFNFFESRGGCATVTPVVRSYFLGQMITILLVQSCPL